MIKFKQILFICLLFAAQNSFAQGFYEINTVQKIEITFRESNWDNMLDTAKAGSDGYIMAQSVLINGVKFDSVGVKYKGNSTYKPTQVKNPLHIELDTYKEQDYEGYTDIKLSNIAKDPSFVREVLSYAILRQYMATSLSNYANVYVNGRLIGLYVNSESVSKKFVNKHFKSKTNTFIKCNPIEGAGPGTRALPNLVYLGNDSASYYSAYELNSTYGWKDLIYLTNTIKNDITGIESVLDVDRALWMLAFDNVTVNLDSYIGVFAQNYYLYKADNGRFNAVLWDFNEGFGAFSQTGTISLPTTSSKSQMTYLLHSGDANWPLVQKLLSIPSYKKMYIAHIQTILSENFANNNYFTMAQSYQTIIDAAVQADANKFFTYSQFKTNLTTDVSNSPGITTLMNARNTYLSSLTDFKATKPSISNILVSNNSPMINSSVYVTAQVSNANSNAIYIGFRSNTTDKFTKHLMLDDGAHGDNIAGDNIFGASLLVNNATIEYYIYTENDNAAVFSPVRAEYEFYTIKGISPSSDIVLNEIYARGTTANPDWVEIYNSSNKSIDIGGYKIYDENGYKGIKLKKTISTGTILGADSYFVVTTDDGAVDAFGLSASGEKVWLENIAGTVIDSVIYATHTTEQSYGRLPDSGSWQLFDSVTPGALNENKTGITAVGSELNDLLVYPNPVNSVANIQISLSKPGIISLKIYNLTGQSIEDLANYALNAGTHTYQWNTEHFNDGVYFIKLQIAEKNITKKLILVKQK